MQTGWRKLLVSGVPMAHFFHTWCSECCVWCDSFSSKLERKGSCLVNGCNQHSNDVTYGDIVWRRYSVVLRCTLGCTNRVEWFPRSWFLGWTWAVTSVGGSQLDSVLIPLTTSVFVLPFLWCEQWAVNTCDCWSSVWLWQRTNVLVQHCDQHGSLQENVNLGKLVRVHLTRNSANWCSTKKA